MIVTVIIDLLLDGTTLLKTYIRLYQFAPREYEPCLAFIEEEGDGFYML